MDRFYQKVKFFREPSGYPAKPVRERSVGLKAD